MDVRRWVMACIVTLAAAMPTRADVILSYRLSNFVPAGPNPPDNWIPSDDGNGGPVALGTPITGPLTIQLGSTAYIQVCLVSNSNAPTTQPSINQNQWSTTNRLITFAFALDYPQSIVSQPFVQPMPPDLDQNNGNATAIAPFQTGYPQFFNMPGCTAITGSTLGPGIGAQPGGIAAERVLAVFKIVGVANGSGTMLLTDLNPSPTAAGFGLAGGENLDPFVFAPAHNNFPLAVQVIPAPEPSSLALAGLALAGIGWRRWRRRTTQPVG